LVRFVRAALAYWVLVGALGSAAGESVAPFEPEAICRRFSHQMNTVPRWDLIVRGHSLEDKPAAWAAHSLYPDEEATSFDVARVHLFGRALNAVTWMGGGSCGMTRVSLWNEDYSSRFSRWGDQEPEEPQERVGSFEWLLKDGPYLLLSDSGQKQFSILLIEDDGDAKPVCEGRQLAVAREQPKPDAVDPVCASLASSEAHSPVVEVLDHALPLDEAMRFQVDHTDVRARTRIDLDNDGAEEWVGLAHFLLGTAGCGDPSDVVWPMLLDGDGKRLLDTATNRTLLHEMGDQQYSPGVKLTSRLIDFHGVRYVEQRSLPASVEAVHKVLRLDGGKVATVCDFHPRLQYEVLPISEGGRAGVPGPPPG
jgi:hypothetical protein